VRVFGKERKTREGEKVSMRERKSACVREREWLIEKVRKS